MLYSETLISPLSELYVNLSPFLYSHSSANVLIPLTTHLTAALTGSLYNSILLVSIAEKYFETSGLLQGRISVHICSHTEMRCTLRKGRLWCPADRQDDSLCFYARQMCICLRSLQSLSHRY